MDEQGSAPVEAPDQMSKGIQRHHLHKVLIVCLVLAGLGSLYWYYFLRHRVSTDNAYVKADSAQISARVPGTVVAVHVENDDSVEKGQILLELDPRDYSLAVDRARASLEEAEAEVKAAELSVPLTETQTRSGVDAGLATLQAARDNEREMRHRLGELESKRMAAADLLQAQRDFERFEKLYRQGAGTERQQEQASTTLKKAQAEIGAMDAQISATRSSLAAVTQEILRSGAQLESRKSERKDVDIKRFKLESLKAQRNRYEAELEAARLNLSYCTLTAPLAGFIAQKNVQVGNRVQPGQPLMALVPLQDIYIEANFKETELTDVRIGQPVTIEADMYPGYSYRGKVAGIRAGTGAVFSLLPPENATGNWIKVVQRVPVKILLDSPPPEDRPLRLGLSLEVTIDTSDQRGQTLRGAMPAP
jgi:membrane fusion protein, multidrug efflux system